MIPALIVPVLNRPDLLRRLLHSIDYPVADLLIIDNGHCLDQAPTDLPTVERTHVLPMPSNLGVPLSWTLGIWSLPFAPWWLIVNSDAWFPRGSLARFAEEARTDALVLSGGSPAWCAFALGEAVVETVGTFDLGIFPAYFEDNLFERACQRAGFDVVHSSIPVHHDNSSTIHSDAALMARNDYTFQANRAYYDSKIARGDYSPGAWSLSTRRRLSWD